MAVFTQSVPGAFDVAPEKTKAFLEASKNSTAFRQMAERAAKNIPGFTKSQKEQGK